MSPSGLRATSLLAEGAAVSRADLLAAVLDEFERRYAAFRADPAFGFPAGTPDGPGPVSWHGMLHLLSGAVVIEAVFAIPGAGSLVAYSAINKDFPVVQGVVLVFVIIVIVIPRPNLVSGSATCSRASRWAAPSPSPCSVPARSSSAPFPT